MRDHPIRLMFYNVENLFDIHDDTLKADDEFLPSGLMRWNFTRYNKKINSVYKTIVAAGEWNPPAIVALCEVENRKVLNDLVYGTYLSKFYYKVIHEDSPDQRGIDVCLIYREDIAENIYFRYQIPECVSKADFTSRSVLYAKFKIYNDTVHFIVNHWPSRRGGVLAGEKLRMEISSMVREMTDSILKQSRGKAKLVIIGDFNSTPDDLEMKSLVACTDSGRLLVNLSEILVNGRNGTYRYMGIWEMIDQVIVSANFLKCNYGLSTDASYLRVFSPDFLLKKYPKYPGFTPFSTFRGYKYIGGFSDHLPVTLDFDFR